jgi:1,4-dihydroxy-2-naphthoate octaprenyltransferase
LIGVLFNTIRPPFLLLTAACCALALSLTGYFSSFPSTAEMIAVMVAALCAHIAVNTLNEYQDFTSGLDAMTQPTPFSGGSGTLPRHPEFARHVLWLSIIALLVTTVAGLFLVYSRGIHLLWMGLLGVVIIVAYTRWINRWSWLCLIAPGTGFGLIMVGGSYYALAGEMNGAVLLVALMVFFLVNNLLLLNQFPDIDADRQVGRNHFPIRYGTAVSQKVYLLFVLATFILLAGGLVTGLLPAAAALALFMLPIGLYAAFGAHRLQKDIARQPGFLAANVATSLLTPALLAVGLFIA